MRIRPVFALMLAAVFTASCISALSRFIGGWSLLLAFAAYWPLSAWAGRLDDKLERWEKARALLKGRKR